MNARHLESPNEATNATKLKLAAAEQKTGSLPPGRGLACPLGDYVRPCRIDESGGRNGSPVCLPIRVSGIFSRELCCIDRPSVVALGPMSAVYRPFRRRKNKDGRGTGWSSGHPPPPTGKDLHRTLHLAHQHLQPRQHG